MTSIHVVRILILGICSLFFLSPLEDIWGLNNAIVDFFRNFIVKRDGTGSGKRTKGLVNQSTKSQLFPPILYSNSNGINKMTYIAKAAFILAK
jgi:hypothetical protein